MLNGLHIKIIDDLFDDSFFNLSMLIVTEIEKINGEIDRFNKMVKERYKTKNPLLMHHIKSKALIDKIRDRVKEPMKELLKIKLSSSATSMKYLEELKGLSEKVADGS